MAVKKAIKIVISFGGHIYEIIAYLFLISNVFWFHLWIKEYDIDWKWKQLS